MDFPSSDFSFQLAAAHFDFGIKCWASHMWHQEFDKQEREALL